METQANKDLEIISENIEDIENNQSQSLFGLENKPDNRNLNFLNANVNSEVSKNESNDNNFDDINYSSATESIITLDNIDTLGSLPPQDSLDNDITDNIVLEVEELSMEEPNDLKEINDLVINGENNLETLTLKKPNQVYFELYKEARKKAKTAKKMAILAYLEAKKIKKTYMIENLNDSDSDIDEEIDEVSESDLEDFNL